MQTGQVSVWVPIVVGIIGLVGIIAGQLVNAWREDRRWRRDQQREEIRWKRDRDREVARLAHESMIDWRECRISIYSDYLGSIDNATKISTELADMVNELRWEEYIGRWREQSKETNRMEQRVLLVCSNRISRAITNHGIDSDLTEIRQALDAPGNTSGIGISTERRLIANKQYNLRKYYASLIHLMREELGTDPATR